MAELLRVVYGKDKFTLHQYKLRMKKMKVNESIEDLSLAKLTFD